MTTIDAVDAWEVLDSRGDPTVRVRVDAGSGTGRFTVPAGASTGAHEAVELRDGGARYGGRGVRGAVETVRTELAPLVTGRAVTHQRAIDETLVEADGTQQLSRLGANAVLGVSGAVAHAASDLRQQPLYEYLADGDPGRIPMPMVNILSGGMHAHGGLGIQDFLVIPVGADTYSEALEMVWTVRTGVKEALVSDGHRPLVADEGGFSPPIAQPETAFEYLEAGLKAGSYVPGEDVAYAVDVAASHLYENGSYTLSRGGPTLDRSAMIDRIEAWVDHYPIVSVEDPLAEDDWEGWRRCYDRLGDTVQILGDDLLVTSLDRLRRARTEGAANAVLVKPNQAGTVTRALDVATDAADTDFGVVVSARSGESCDVTIADLAVAVDAGQIKIGSLARSERLAKYNRLTAIDREHRRPLANPTVSG